MSTETKTKVIFLDIDGVVKVDGGYNQAIIHRIKKICELTGAQIVLTSDLRRTSSPEHWEMRKGIKDLMDHLHLDWMTPVIHQDRRADEILQWIRNNDEIGLFVILDDNRRIFDGAPEWMTERVVWCNNRFGFVGELVDRTMELLERA